MRGVSVCVHVEGWGYVWVYESCMGMCVVVFFFSNDLALAQADAKHGDALHEANEIEHALNKMTSSTMAIAHLLYSIGISRGISPPL